MWDPTGCHLSRGSNPVGKQYHHTGTDLPSRFSDQFDPWDFAGADVKSGYDGTLLRLPLRTAAQASGSKIWTSARSPEALVQALHSNFCGQISHALLFLGSLRRVRVFRWDNGAQSARPIHASKVACAAGESARLGTAGNNDKSEPWRKGLQMGLRLVNRITNTGQTKLRGFDADLCVEDFGLAADTHSVTQTGWFVAICDGPATSRDGTLQRKFASLQLVPRAAVAFCVSSGSSTPSIAPAGGLFAPLPMLGKGISLPNSQADNQQVSGREHEPGMLNSGQVSGFLTLPQACEVTRVKCASW